MDPKLYQQLLETFQDELKERHQEIVDALLSLELNPVDKQLEETLLKLFRSSHNIKGAAKSVSIDIVASIAHHLENLFSDWRQNKYIPTKDQINGCLKVADNLLNALQDHLSGETSGEKIVMYLAPLTNSATKVKAATPAGNDSHDMVRLPINKIEKSNAKADELMIFRLHLEKWLQQSAKQSHHYKHQGQKLLSEFTRLLQGLQNDLREMRLVPINWILEPLKRHVREVAQELDKDVQLNIKGGDIFVDKCILNFIKIPLEHLVRNAIDHGIESSEERKKLSKSVVGQLNINITQKAGRILLEFFDDGRGIDLSEIEKKARSLGLIESGTIITENDILNLIFKSGFTTKEKVTEISGRGVGLDAVRNEIEKAHGSLQIKSQKGFGTHFYIDLPATLATTRGLTVSVADQQFILPSLSIGNILEISHHHIKQVGNEHVYVMGKTPIPLRFLVDLLNISEAGNPLNYSIGILLEYQDKKNIILVDQVIDEQDCIVKPLPNIFKTLPQFLGANLADNGKLTLVLNTEHLWNKFSTSIFKEKSSTSKCAIEKKRILVVDDSLTSRSLTVNSLIAAGFEAKSACDGEKAWHLLQTESFNLIVTDIEMPNMDGFELTQKIKSNEKLKKIPIIVVTSRESEGEKKHGLDLGVDFYLVKSQFNTKSLIEQIRTLI